MPTDREFTGRLLDGLALFFAAMAVAVRPMHPGHSPDLNLWVSMCVFLSATAWLVGQAGRRRLRVACSGVGLPLLALLAVAFVSTLRSPHKAASIAVLLDWTTCAVLFTLIVSLTAGGVDRRLFLRVLWASAFVVVLYGLFQQFVNLPLTLRQLEGDRQRVLLELGMNPKEYDNLVQRARGRIYATFLVANSFAGFLCLIIPGFVGHVLDRLRAGDRGKGFLALSGLWTAGALACLLLTYSRGGWLAFAVAAVLFCLMLGAPALRRHRRIVGGIGIGAALAVILLFATGVVPVRVFRDGVASFAVRVDYWRGAWDMAMAHPIAGVGLGTFGDHYPAWRTVTARMVRAAHNDYLQVFAELGVLGLAAFLWTWGPCLRGAARPRDDMPNARSPERLGLGAGLAAFALTMG
ncbi:O-antigen ligase family protein, partial [bacterium]|nr:O-antigen ligase family protein [bacterium]